ncbi:CDP-diacylglycerol--serine O-phosphatidyltransferase [Marilutibacter chinensis]|uniref:CDP-diacylglycerol--serine O-phosphatidyltransferase n=1 Tax=Marilutibacter chinensis TaxID=2912247 RepID=A0ABS9HRJ3_9GAMM|nr:CDP-diacylglycerol--serine O-phosphatidyltransferase [Lysobacter chinensis]MCF7221288.1 CDP-diacylglycerol--serine O-phosphatidyltransferase [Lysobacter chinensis]
MQETQPPSRLPPRPRNRGIYLLPNLFTTGGLFAGFYAIIAASQGRFDDACIAVFVAAVLDGVDGRVARLTHTQSEFGVQYDSLADLISFGLAPALVMYHWALSTMKFDSVTAGKVGWIAAFLYAACAALRLARFNSQVAVVDKRWFIGLASPAAAGLMASFVWTAHELGYTGEQLRYPALVLTVVAAVLMVSGLRYFSFKSGPRNDRVPFLAIMLAVAAVVAIAIDPPSVLLAASALYALSGPMSWLYRRVRRGGGRGGEDGPRP